MSSILDQFGDGKKEARNLAFGSVSRVTPDGVYATLPSFNATHDYGPMPFEHVDSMEVGDSILVAFDEQGSPWIAAWDGEAGVIDPTAIHVGTAAGGVLSGTYPDPDFAADMATQAELGAHTGLTTTAHGGIVASTDARLTDARTPTAHAATHAAAGSDPVTIAESQVTGLTADLAAKSPLASPTFTGTPAAPTAAVDTNTTQIATTAFVLGQASSSIAPADSGIGAIGTSKRYARADHVHPVDISRAPLASPTLTGTPAAPTAAQDTNTTQLATTAFVMRQLLKLTDGFTAGTQYIVKAGSKSATTDGGGNITVTFPTAFPTACDYVFAVSKGLGAQPVFRIGSRSASQFVAFFNAATQAEDFDWIAIGH